MKGVEENIKKFAGHLTEEVLIIAQQVYWSFGRLSGILHPAVSFLVRSHYLLYRSCRLTIQMMQRQTPTNHRYIAAPTFPYSSSTRWLTGPVVVAPFVACSVAKLERGPPIRCAVTPIGFGFSSSLAVLGNNSHCAFCIIRWSTNVNATMASTMGTARGSTQGSCRPLPRNSTSCPSRVTVF